MTCVFKIVYRSTDIKLPELEQQIEDATAALVTVGAGVVCMTSREAAAYAAHSSELSQACHLELWKAPAPNDVCWEAMGETMSATKTYKGNLRMPECSSQTEFSMIYEEELHGLRCNLFTKLTQSCDFGVDWWVSLQSGCWSHYFACCSCLAL